MSTVITIQQLEAAINAHSSLANPSTETYALSANVSMLADIYGRMIHAHQKEIAETELNEVQRALITSVLPEQTQAAA